MGQIRNSPMPVAARAKAWVCGRSLAGVAGSNTAKGTDVCLGCVLSGRDPWDRPIPHPEKFYTECGVSVKCNSNLYTDSE